MFNFYIRNYKAKIKTCGCKSKTANSTRMICITKQNIVFNSPSIWLKNILVHDMESLRKKLFSLSQSTGSIWYSWLECI